MNQCYRHVVAGLVAVPFALGAILQPSAWARPDPPPPEKPALLKTTCTRHPVNGWYVDPDSAPLPVPGVKPRRMGTAQVCLMATKRNLSARIAFIPEQGVTSIEVFWAIGLENYESSFNIEPRYNETTSAPYTYMSGAVARRCGETFNALARVTVRSRWMDSSGNVFVAAPIVPEGDQVFRSKSFRQSASCS